MEYKIIKSINDKTKIADCNGKTVVVKEIPLADTEMFQKLSTINNPNVVSFFGTTVIGNKFYAVEEFVSGVVLTDYVNMKNGLSKDETIRIAVQICNGLKAVHSLGIVHRDITPNNIMITKDGIAKIIDFGISRTTKANQSCDTQILGTQGYAAPEQFGFHQTNSKADIYSVGVLINYMQTLKLPSEELADNSLTEIVLKCTQIDENNRYRDIEALSMALKNKRRLKQWIKSLPGFRKGVWWHILIAVPYYLALGFCLFMSIVSARSFLDGFYTFSVFFLFFGVPVSILMNHNNWIDRFPLTANKTEKKKAIIKFLLATLSVIASFAFIIADSYL